MKKPISQRAGTSLNEVLAFLDTLDSCESDFRDSSSGEKIEGKPEVGILVTGGCKELNSRTTVQLRQQQKVEKEKLQDRFVPYSTDLQRRKRAELHGLRSQLQLLQNHLAELKQLRHKRMEMMSVSDSVDDNNWQKAALIACEERQRSERLNRKLKSILESQAQVHRSVGDLLNKRNVLEGIEVVFRDQPTAGRDAIQLDFNASSFAELSHSVETMRLEVDNVLPALNDCSTLAFCSQQPRKNRDTTKSSFCRIRKKKCTPDQVNGVVALLDGAQRVDGVSVFGDLRKAIELFCLEQHFGLFEMKVSNLKTAAGLSFRRHQWTLWARP
ncbi:uncharacterized protein IUM83_01311 [Phytophthora cinnamomi]|uniref:uncharacterized protein n=1 Tax=Phytophthora cinnamomi TaxID=4785 RepID=UPI003559D96B|nr:hypothetical protein IUM83_01311 [Phytophthora cinnamomi]